nr:PREDICTED: lengsin isoform X1 [Struthio camelus australis]XP_009685338.1 PREDICTED: lengsin isoform X1 [Struthio camelus australis]XP_009685339.1 PREDICTED: lengsin isoform X1 [Struthio camelus australis]XP_009685340.1 PREDICTED: lengsin isoform X1 [Struthio camelus australis]
MDKKEDVSQQNISGSGNDEADGNNICGFRKKKGVKGTAKHVPPLANEKMELSNSSKILNLYHLQGTTSHSEPPSSDQTLQNLASFPPVQKDRGCSDSCHIGSDMEEDMSRGTAEIQKNADTGKGMNEKIHKEIDTPAKMDLPVEVLPASDKEKAECFNIPNRERNTDRTETENKEDECGGTEEAAKFCMTQASSPDSSVATQGSGTGEPFVGAPGISKQTLEELENLLSEGPLLNHGPKYNGKAGGTFFQKILKPREKVDKQGRSFETFSPHFGEENQKHPVFHYQGAGQQSKPLLFLSSAGSDQQQPEGSDVDQPNLRLPATSENAESSTSESQFDSAAGQTVSSREPDINGLGSPTLLHQFSHIEFIKQQMARDNVQFVRFESIDLHGVSRSKNIPSRFFHEKAIHGVSMPRSYLELTLNPKDSEIDYINATNFNCDIILSPDLATFRILPWTEQTARVICDSFTVLGNPLMTSPRHIAKKQLSQLQDNGFSLCSAFTYEFCIYGITEVVNSKTISFPAATILNNHDQAFIQELIEGMYYTGANIESFSSSSGPGQMEITFHPEFGIDAADSAFTFRTGIKEVAKKYNYVASFFSESGFYNSGILSHSLWDLNGQKNLFSVGYGAEELTDVGKNWLSGLLAHTAAISCLMAPTTSCRKPYSKYSKETKETVNAKWAYNDNSCAFNVKCHDGKGTHIENRLSSAAANPYLVLAATVAAGLDGVKRGLRYDIPQEENHISDLKPSSVPLKLEDALVALEKDSCIKEALGETFVQYFVAMKHYELETEEMDGERNKCLGYFI